MERNSRRFILIYLGMLSAFGPFVTDMYLPGLPLMQSYFHASTSMVQLGLTASMLGMALGQLLIGPLSDKFGRRMPLMGAMLLYLIATLGCIYAPDMEGFVAMRFVQGIAGAGGIVLSRCIAADLHTGRELAVMLALVGAINGIAPVVSPVIGGVVMNFTDWRGVFWILFLLGILLSLGSLVLRESHHREHRSKRSVWTTFASFWPVFKNASFRRYMLIQSFVLAVMFANISSSPFIVQQHYGFEPLTFSIWFAVNAAAIAVAAMVSMRFSQPEKAMSTGVWGIVVLSLCAAAVLYFDGPFWMYESLIFLILFTVGLVVPTSTTLAMESERRHSGSASALLGAGVFVMAGVVSPLVGMGTMLHSTGLAFVVCALAALVFLVSKAPRVQMS